MGITNYWIILIHFVSLHHVIDARINTKPKEKEINVTGIVDGSVHLPCDVYPEKANDRIYLILWYKDGVQEPIYSFDARSDAKDVKQGIHWFDDQILGKRASFAVTPPPGMSLSDLIIQDAGTYRCRVDFKKSKTRNVKINLVVIVPPERVEIKDHLTQSIDETTEPYNEGDELHLTCRVYGGNPLPEVNWLRDNKVIDASYDTLDGEVRANDLIIRTLKREDLLGSLTCIGKNNNISSPIKKTVRINMNLKPVLAELEGASKAFSSGKHYEISCHVYGSKPDPVITWWKNSESLSEKKVIVDGNVTTSTVVYVAREEDRGKNLICNAISPAYPINVVQASNVLDVYYVPKAEVKIGMELQPDNFQEGEDVFLDCIVKAHPPVYKVSWRHNGDIMVQNVTAGLIISNHTLVLQKVGKSNGGVYNCIATNLEGDGESPDQLLTIKYSPVCKQYQTYVYGVAKMEEVVISCEVDAEPRVLSFKWAFNNTSETVDIHSKHYTSAGFKSTIKYKPINDLDYGTLLCWARNEIGSQKVPCIYHIIAAGKPDSLKNCSTNVTENSVDVLCIQGFDGGLPQHFQAEIYSEDSSWMFMNVSSATPNFTIRNLTPSTAYTINLAGVNAKGRGKTQSLIIETLEDRTKKQVSGLTTADNLPTIQILLVLVGCLTTLVIIFIVVIIVIKIKKKKRGRPPEGVRKLSPLHEGDTKSIGDSGSSETDDKNPDIIPQSCDSVPREMFPNTASVLNSERIDYRQVPYLYSMTTLPRIQPNVTEKGVNYSELCLTVPRSREVQLAYPQSSSSLLSSVPSYVQAHNSRALLPPKQFQDPSLKLPRVERCHESAV